MRVGFFAENAKKKKESVKVKIMAKNKCYPIENGSAMVSMIFMGLILVALGIWSREINLFLKETNITSYFLIYAALGSFLLVVIELGIKRYSDLSKLKKFNNQQLVSFGVACLVVVSSIFATFLPGLSWLTWFNGGVFVVQGLTVILEAFR